MKCQAKYISICLMCQSEKIQKSFTSKWYNHSHYLYPFKVTYFAINWKQNNSCSINPWSLNTGNIKPSINGLDTEQKEIIIFLY